jgi:hypothetical protein
VIRVITKLVTSYKLATQKCIQALRELAFRSLKIKRRDARWSTTVAGWPWEQESAIRCVDDERTVRSRMFHVFTTCIYDEDESETTSEDLPTAAGSAGTHGSGARRAPRSNTTKTKAAR